MFLEDNQWALIQKYVSGNACPEECRLIDRWVNEHPENKKLVREIEEIWDLMPAETIEVDIDRAWEQVQRRKIKNSREKNWGANTRRSHRTLLYLLRVAAIIIVMLVAGFFMHEYLPSSSETDQISGFYMMRNFETEKGEKARITFSDGTRVILNSASTLRFPNEFQGSLRKVYLDGEAYFDVADDPDHPFIVYTQESHIQVLGTGFNVRSWRADSLIEITVREGKVAINSSSDEDKKIDSPVILTEGFYTRVEKGKEPSLIQRIDVRNHLIWTQGGLYFNNTPFRQVIRDIERRFNVEVILNKPLAELIAEVPFTSTFNSADLNEILTVIAEAMKLEFNREDTKIEFFKG